ncbi:MAG: DNA polymerase III subunit beta [Succinivibrio sp.]|nr:DNA polymerase III subunit beta [Succinivibrio sp.]
MNFTVLLSAVIKQLGEVASIAGSAPNKEDITQNILICAENGVLTLKATNYNIELITVINEVTIESEGRITVNAKKIKEILGNLDPNVLVNFEYIADKGLLKISTPVSNFEIRTRAADDFPSFDVENIDQTIVVQQKQLKNLIDSSIFCVSNEDFRDYLKGIRLELMNGKLDVFTSDGHRMAVIELKLEGQTVQNPSGTFGAIITKSCAQQLSKILEESAESTVTLQFTKNAVLTTCNNYSLASKLINCGYPNVRAIIPKAIDKSVLVPKDELSALIKQISVLSSKRANGITFNFGDGLVRFRAENSEHEVSTGSMPLPGAQEPIEISLNAQYVREVLGAIKGSDNVLFCFGNPIINVLIKPEKEENECGVKSSYIISKVLI